MSATRDTTRGSLPSLAVWTPLPPSPSGVADYAAEQLPGLAQHFDVRVVVEHPDAVSGDVRRSLTDSGVLVISAAQALDRPAALDFYQVGNSPAHGYVYRAALERPGVVLLHDFVLHHLVLHETLERGDTEAYLREMRHAHGGLGSFVGRQVARALGGQVLPALFPLNVRLLERTLGLVALSASLATRAATRMPGRPVLHLPHHLALPLDPLPERSQARRDLGLPPAALLLVAPGLASRAKRLDVVLQALARLLPDHPDLRLVVAGELADDVPLHAWARAAGVTDALITTGRVSLPDFVRHLVAADVVLALRFPSHGEMSGALVRALGVGRAVLVSAGTPAADEFGEGLTAWVDPGVRELDSLTATLDRLLRAPELRARLGQAAGLHVRRAHALAVTQARLSEFLANVLARRAALLAHVTERHARPGSLHEFLLDEARFGALDVGLPTLPDGVESRLAELCTGSRA